MRTNTWKVDLAAFVTLLGLVLTVVMLWTTFAEGARFAGPKDVSGLQLWLDASVQCQGVADATAQATWSDLSGNGYHFTDAAGASTRPTCQTAAGDLINGKPVLNFDGTDDRLYQVVNANEPGLASDQTIFVVVKTTDSAGGLLVHYNEGSPFTGWGVAIGLVAANRLSYWSSTKGAWNGPTGAVNDGIARVLTVTRASGSVDYYNEGSASLQTDTGHGNAAGSEAAIIGAIAGGGTRLAGDLMEILVYSSALSAVNRRAVEKYLQRKWSVGHDPVPALFVSGKLPAKQRQGNCTDSGVALWEDFEEASGNLTVPTGCAAAGTVLTANGNGLYQQGTGDAPPGVGVALVFDGTGDYFTSTSDVNSLDFGTSNVVVEAWVKIDSTAAVSDTIASKYDGTNGWILYMDGTSILFFVRGDGVNLCEAGNGTASPRVNGSWTRVRATWTNSTGTCTIYTDGNPVSTNTVAATAGDTISNAVAFEIGSREAGNNTVVASIADLRVTIGNATNDLGFSAGAHSGTSGTTLTAPTFTRATASTRVNPVTGLVETVASGVPVVGAPLSSGDDGTIDGTEPTGVYVGSATTFVLLQNEDMSNAAWAKDATVTVNNDTAPDGTSTADKVAPNLNGILRQQSASGFVCSTVSTCTATAWFRSATGADVATTLYILGGSGSVIGTCAITVTTTWQKFVCTNTGTEAGNGYWRLGTGGDTTWTTGEDIYVWRPQAYAKGFAVPLDPAVVASSVTVNADTVSYSQAPGDLGTVCAWVNLGATGGNRNAVMWNGASADFYALRFGGTGYMAFITAGLADNATASQGQNPVADNVWTHVCASWDQANSAVRIYKSGVEEATGGSDETWTAGGAYGSMSVGDNGAGAEHTSGFQSDVRYYGQVLSPQQIRALHASRSAVYAVAPTPRERLQRQIMLASAAPLDFVLGYFSPSYWKRENEASAKRYVASEHFPKAALHEAQP